MVDLGKMGFKIGFHGLEAFFRFLVQKNEKFTMYKTTYIS